MIGTLKPHNLYFTVEISALTIQFIFKDLKISKEVCISFPEPANNTKLFPKAKILKAIIHVKQLYFMFSINSKSSHFVDNTNY